MFRSVVLFLFLLPFLVHFSRAQGDAKEELLQFDENQVITSMLIRKLPKEIREFFESLTDADFNALNAAAEEIYADVKQGNLTSEQACAILRKYSPSLADRVERLRTQMMAKVEKLSDDVRRFINNTISKITTLTMKPGDTDMVEVVTILQGIVREAFSLPDSAKVEVQRVFPETTELFQNLAVVAVAREFAQMTPEQLNEAVQKFGEGMGAATENKEK